MKKILSLVLTTTFLCSTSVQAMDDEYTNSKSSSSHESVDPKKNLLLKCREYLESEKDFYEDRGSYIEGVQKEYENDLKEKAEVDALNIASQKLGITETISCDTMNSFLSASIEDSQIRVQFFSEEINKIYKTLKNNGKSIEKVKNVFSHLLKYHTDALKNRLSTWLIRKRISELELCKTKAVPYTYEEADEAVIQIMNSNTVGDIAPWLPPTCQDYVDKEKQEINKELSRTATTSYQQRLYFLKKLYKWVKVHLTEEQRATIQLNKNFYDILEGKAKDLGYPDQVLETSPSVRDIENAINYWKKTKKNNLILVYYHRSSHLEEKQMVFVKDHQRTPKIDWDRVTLQNIDDVLPQVNHFFPNLSEKSKLSINNYIKKKREQLQLEPKKRFEILKYEVINVESPKAPPLKYEMIKVDTPKAHPIISVKRTKNREERKQQWEKEQQKIQKRLEKQKLAKETENSKGEKNNDNSSATSPKLSEDTITALSKFFKITPVKTMLWDDFVKAWKELRKVIDDVEDEPENVDGSNRKFRGGPLQGSKNKARSFNIHEPHPIDGMTIGPKAITRVGRLFQEKFGWTLEKLKEYGFEILTDNNKKQINVEEKTN